MSRQVAVLHLEDSVADAKLVAAALRADGLDVAITRVDAADAYMHAVDSRVFDVILSDYSLPAYDGQRALEHAKESTPHIPFVVVSGALGEEVAVDLLKAGATDY